jgi:hypothetical protein
MSLMLHPRAADPGSIRVWLGLTGATAPPAPQWQIASAGNAPAAPASAPTALRPLGPVRPPNLAPGDPPRVCAGLYEFPGLVPGAAYDVTATVGNEQTTIRARSLPDVLPEGPDDWFNILLVSCFHYYEASPQAVENAVAQAREECDGYGGHRKELHLSVLMGDQVYLDLPTLKDFPPEAEKLAAKFEDDYRRNWFGEAAKTRSGKQVNTGYAAVLAAAPSVCLPDDHEYWNNFPHCSPFIGNSWKAEDRAAWCEAARTLFEGFQLHEPGKLGHVVKLNLPPLSLCLADSRTFRAYDFQQQKPKADEFANSLSSEARAAVGEWVARSNAAGHFGLFATGQSLLSTPAGGFGKRIADAELADYADFREYVGALTSLGRPALYLTGDVHWGRFAELRDFTRGGTTTAFEIITSPCALVTTVGSDGLARAWGKLKGLFGAKDPWPRHDEGDMAEVPKHFPGPFLNPTTHHRQQGDQISVLSLQRQGSGAGALIKARLRYYPIHPDTKTRDRFRHNFEFTLRPNL